MDGSDKKESWFVQELEIHMPTKGQSYLIPVNQWFGKEKEDGATKRKFTIDDSSVSKVTSKPSKVVIDISPMSNLFYCNISFSENPHELLLHTGDLNDSGTSSNVFVKLFGTSGCTDEIFIEKFGERFERGRTDIIKVRM